MTRKTATDEFSLVVRPADLSSQPARWELDATEAERASLAARFGLLGIDSLHADLALEWLAGRHLLRLSGRIRAEVTQRCVVSLRPVRNRIDEPFEMLFAEPEEGGAEIVVDLDDVEPLTGEELDIAEIAAEEFALMLDQYPRAPDAALEKEGFGPGASNGREKGPESASTAGNRPFEVLAALKRNK